MKIITFLAYPPPSPPGRGAEGWVTLVSQSPWRFLERGMPAPVQPHLSRGVGKQICQVCKGLSNRELLQQKFTLKYLTWGGEKATIRTMRQFMKIKNMTLLQKNVLNQYYVNTSTSI